jgi:hypothetical protein
MELSLLFTLGVGRELRCLYLYSATVTNWRGNSLTISCDSIAESTQRQVVKTNFLGMIWRTEVMASCYSPLNFLEGTEENHKQFIEVTVVSAEFRTETFRNASTQRMYLPVRSALILNSHKLYY